MIDEISINKNSDPYLKIKRKGKDLPPLWQQAIPMSIFAGGTVVSNYAGMGTVSILAADGFALTLKNILKVVKDLQSKLVLLGIGTACGFGVDLALKHSNMKPLDLGSLGAATSISILDRELNLFISGKGKDSNGNKTKIKQSPVLIASIVAAFAIATILSGSLELPAALTDSTLKGLATSAKHLSRDQNSLIILTTLGLAWYVLASQSIVPSNAKTASLGLTLLLKHAIYSLEQYQMGDDADEEDDNETGNELIAGAEKRPPACMEVQVLMTAAALTAACTSQMFSEYLSPVVTAALSKAGSRFFSNIMRQFPQSTSAPITLTSAATLFIIGMILLKKSKDAAAGNIALAVATNLPFGEIKTWQLGKKVLKKQPSEESPVNVPLITPV